MATQRLRPVPIGARLNPRQWDLLTFIAGREACPTFEEMAAAAGLKNKGSVGVHLKALEGLGYIRRLPRRARAVEVIRPVPPQRPWTEEQGLAFARAWRIRMKPHFDAIYGPELARRGAR